MITNDRVKIGKDCYIDERVEFFGKVEIGDKVYIERNVIIGKPNEQEIAAFMASERPQKSMHEFIKGTVTIGSNCRIRAGTVIHSGVAIGDDTDCFNNVLIGTRTRIESHGRIGDFSQIHNDVQIGRSVRFKGYAANRCIIGNNLAMLGYLVHEFKENKAGIIEPSPTIRDGAIVGMLAIVVGEVTVGKEAYVAAGSVVLADVRDRQLVAGVPARLIRQL